MDRSTLRARQRSHAGLEQLPDDAESVPPFELAASGFDNGKASRRGVERCRAEHAGPADSGLAIDDDEPATPVQ